MEQWKRNTFGLIPPKPLQEALEANTRTISEFAPMSYLIWAVSASVFTGTLLLMHEANVFSPLNHNIFIKL